MPKANDGMMTSERPTRKVAICGLTLEVRYHSDDLSPGFCWASEKAPWRPRGSGGKNGSEIDLSAATPGSLRSMSDTWPVARCETSRRLLASSISMPNGSVASWVGPLLSRPSVQLGWN